jgi:hypothetical protein
MTIKTAKWASELDQIVKSRLLHDRPGKISSSGSGKQLYWRRSEGYLGNVGLEMPLNKILRMKKMHSLSLNVEFSA